MKTPALIKSFLAHVESTSEPNTLASWTQALNRFAEFAEGKPLKTPLILEYRAYLTREGLKESSVSAYLVPLRRMFSWAVQMEHLASNPMPKLAINITAAAKEPILAVELERLILEVQCIKGYEHWPNALRVGWHTGLRLSDVAMLRKDSLNVPESAIKAVPKKTKKFHRVVEIPVPPELITALLEESGAEYVFNAMARRYRKDGHKSLSAQFNYLAHKAEIVGKDFRSFRRSFITRNLNKGVSPAFVSEMTGINLKQLMSYFRPTLEEKRAALGLTQRKEQGSMRDERVIAEEKKLKLWNGRGHGDYKRGVLYVCAKSYADAERLMQQALNSKMRFQTELKIYYAKGCWGDSMRGIEPERGVWAQKDRRSPIVRLI